MKSLLYIIIFVLLTIDSYFIVKTNKSNRIFQEYVLLSETQNTTNLDQISNLKELIKFDYQSFNESINPTFLFTCWLSPLLFGQFTFQLQ